MSDKEETFGAEQHDVKVDELATLKARADLVGFKYHHRVGLEKLRKDLAEFMEAQNTQEAVDEAQTAPQTPAPVKGMTPSGKPIRPASDAEIAKQKRKKAAELVRVVVNCMNPNKREWEGEIFTVSNGTMGTFKKYVPFNNENGWHIPRIMLNMLEEKQCQVFHTVTRGNGQKVREGHLIKEFNIRVLPNLTVTELKDLANQQAMAKGQAS